MNGIFGKGMVTGLVIGSCAGMLVKYACDNKNDIKKEAKKVMNKAEKYMNSYTPFKG